jgi:RNA polymerase subunit RPABC4/transcription elongation factor Spt4
MKTAPQTWFACGSAGATTLRCAACTGAIDLQFPPADHHPRICPACGVECVFLDWRGRIIQIVTARAPLAFAAGVRWAQRQLDELEFAEFLCALEEIAAALHEGTGNSPNQSLRLTGGA